MLAEIITIGDELLIGQTIDTNGSWIGEKLNSIGLQVSHITSIQDKREQILNALKLASERSNLVIVTGGLGPTNDDITKHTLCEYFESDLTLNTDILKKIEDYFKSKNLEMLKVNKDQALLPHNCLVLENIRGTASGMWFEKKGVVYISLPGVPYEMKGIMNENGLSRIIERFSKGKVVNKTVKTHGLGESYLAEIIKKWEQDLVEDNVSLAYLPSPGIVKLRLTAIGENEQLLLDKIENYIDQLIQLIPDYIFGFENDSLESVVGDLLRNKQQTLSLAESCTGGNISKMITSVSGCSDYYKGSVIAYSNEIKQRMLLVENEKIEFYGAVSREVVEQMALGLTKKFNTDYGLATSGIAGPTGGTKEKPVGTVWIAVANAEKVISKKFNFGNSRERNITISSLAALNMLRLELLK